MNRIVENHQDFFLDNKNANKYLEELKKSSKARFLHFLSSLKKLNISGKYLEIGCGPGILTKMIARQHPTVIIIANDISTEMIELAKQDLDEELKTRIKYMVGNACKIESLKDLGKFDLIYSTFTMHHWENAKIAIQNLYSMLKENGLLYIHDLKRVFWLYYIKSQNGFFSSIRASYKPREIREILNNIGINTYKIKTIFPYFMQAIVIKK
jgi:2-polyprenyl-3-methyl-5-hydroxy-6-metoxy-1,4-benzoquinol methylase